MARKRGTYKHVENRGGRLVNRGTNGAVAVGNAAQRLDDQSDGDDKMS
jgi:hypothetical protein